MNQYLTEKALRRRRSDWVWLTFSLLFGAAGISVTQDYIVDNPNQIAVSVVMTLVFMLPGCRVIFRRIRKHSAKVFAGYFEHVHDHRVSFDSMKAQLPPRCTPKLLQSLIHDGLLQNVYIDYEKNELVFPMIAEKAPDRWYAVQCPSCGANNSAIVGKMCHCRFCGSALPDHESA